MDLKKLATGALGAVQRNPQLVLAILGLLAPKVATKVTQAVAAAGVLRGQQTS